MNKQLVNQSIKPTEQQSANKQIQTFNYDPGSTTNVLHPVNCLEHLDELGLGHLKEVVSNAFNALDQNNLGPINPNIYVLNVAPGGKNGLSKLLHTARVRKDVTDGNNVNIDIDIDIPVCRKKGLDNGFGGFSGFSSGVNSLASGGGLASGGLGSVANIESLKIPNTKSSITSAKKTPVKSSIAPVKKIARSCSDTESSETPAKKTAAKPSKISNSKSSKKKSTTVPVKKSTTTKKSTTVPVKKPTVPAKKATTVTVKKTVVTTTKSTTILSEKTPVKITKSTTKSTKPSTKSTPKPSKASNPSKKPVKPISTRTPAKKPVKK